MSPAAPPPPNDPSADFALRLLELAFDEGTADAGALVEQAAADPDCLARIVQLIEDVSYLRAAARARGLELGEPAAAVATLEALLDDVMVRLADAAQGAG